jgi:hypothetical protein
MILDKRPGKVCNIEIITHYIIYTGQFNEIYWTWLAHLRCENLQDSLLQGMRSSFLIGQLYLQPRPAIKIQCSCHFTASWYQRQTIQSVLNCLNGIRLSYRAWSVYLSHVKRVNLLTSAAGLSAWEFHLRAPIHQLQPKNYNLRVCWDDLIDRLEVGGY